MSVTIGGIISWLAPILSTIIITAATVSINAQAKKHERVADGRHQETEKKRKQEAEWRGEVDRLMQEQGDALYFGRYQQQKAVIRSDGKRYECTAEAAKDLGVTYSAVMHVLRGLNETCKGFKFSYA